MDHILCFLIRIFVAFSRWAKTFARLGIGSYDEWEQGRPVKILIAGYNGARNTGADARVAAAVRQIKELFGTDKIKITVMTMSKENMQGYFHEDIDLFQFSSIYIKDLYRACSTHHAAVLCEGSTLKSTFANALSMFYCEAAGIMSKQGKPCITFGSEVGSMDGFLKRMAEDMCKDTYFIARTRESQLILNEMGIKNHLGTDTAWLYEDGISSAHAEDLLRLQGWDGKKPLLGISVIDPFCWPVRPSLVKWFRSKITGNSLGQYDKWYFYSDSPERRKAYNRYMDQMSAAAAAFCKEHDMFPVVLGMEIMDAGPCRELQKRIGCPGAVFLSEEYSADIMTGILHKLSILVTSRYHAAVLSMKEGCPIVAVSMDERLDSLMKEVELDDAYLHHVADEDLGQKILGSLGEGYDCRSELKEHLQQQYTAYREKQKDMGIFLQQYITDNLPANK